jgi:hypothetical protein
MHAWVIYKLETGELRYACACATLAAAKAEVEHALPDGQWLHGYRHNWDYMFERSPHRKAVAFRVQLQAVPDGGLGS